LNNYREFLKDHGIVHLKTDNSELFYYTKTLAERNALKIIAATNDLYTERTEDEILLIKTHYEDLFTKDGLKIHYLSFQLEKNKLIEDAPKEVEGK
jgi:tRNA (guanine-N7-)-methyltransferase